MKPDGARPVYQWSVRFDFALSGTTKASCASYKIACQFFESDPDAKILNPAVGEDLARPADGNMMRHDPCVAATQDASEIIQGVRIGFAAEDTDQTGHLAFEVFRAEQIESIFQNAAHAAVIFGGSEDQRVRFTHRSP